MGLPPQDFDDLQRKVAGNDNSTLIFNVSPTIVPFGPADKTVYNVGPLADDYIPKHWDGPSSDLVAFLRDNPSPICIGFGSMPVQQRDAVMEALEHIDQPVIIVGKAFESVPTQGHPLFIISSVPYAWLLPHCSMMLCHGGAGVVAATLRAGIPCLVAPLMGDQFFWASLLERRGLGLKVSENLASMTCQEIIEAIANVTDDMMAKAKTFGVDIRNKRAGVDEATAAMESFLQDRS